MADQKKAKEFYDRAPTIEKENNQNIDTRSKEVYIFVSFDLVNSTQLKMQYPKWLNLIKKLIDISKSDWLGLNFWKFNGDELLYYAKITAINQLINVLHSLYKSANELTEKLKSMVCADAASNYAEDLIGVKTAIWMASFEQTEDALNSKLEHINAIDFAGVNMDEGFRMSKCVAQNKFIVDPKIAFIICLIGYGFNQKTRMEPALFKRLKSKPTKSLTPNELFEIFINKPNNRIDNEVFERLITDSFVRVANEFRMVGYETCKGVWSKRNYPIIWYSDGWSETINKIRYDEVYLGKSVDKNVIDEFYKEKVSDDNYNGQDGDKLLVTYKLLSKIYDDVGIFKQAVFDILLESNLQLYTNAGLDIQVGTRTYIYYSIVCIKKNPDGDHGVLSFLRSDARGHLPNTWDFEHQKNAQTSSGEDVIAQIEDKFESNFGIRIKVVRDKRRNSLKPMDIHPVFRRGNLHNGILCFAYIEDELSEEQIISKVKGRFNQVVSGYGYPMYSDACFIHRNQLHSEPNNYCTINGENIIEISNDDVCRDSTSWDKHDKKNTRKCITNFVYTVCDAIEYANLKGQE